MITSFIILGIIIIFPLLFRNKSFSRFFEGLIASTAVGLFVMSILLVSIGLVFLLMPFSWVAIGAILSYAPYLLILWPIVIFILFLMGD